MPTPGLQVLIPAEAIARRVTELGAQLTRAYAGRDLLVLPLLGGAFCFVADLVRAIDHPDLRLHFARASSYGGTTSPQHEPVLADLPDCQGRQVLIVDDILDTGRTLDAVRRTLAATRPAGVAACVLLDKPSRRQVPVQADFVGWAIPDRFVVGYGLDFQDRFRHLRDLCVYEGPA